MTETIVWIVTGLCVAGAIFLLILGRIKGNLLIVFFDWVSGTLNSGERAFLDFLSVLVPYAVPVIPAYLTYYHTMEMMHFPPWVAGTSAFVVEVLGLTAVTTAIRFYRHNLKYKDSKNRAPFLLAVGVYVFYLVVVLYVNVGLEKLDGARSDAIINAIAAFSLLGVPSGVLVSIRAQHRDILDEREAAKGGNKPKPKNEPKQKYASDFEKEIRAMLAAEHQKSGNILAPREITARLKLDHDKSKGYVSTLTGKWKDENNIKELGF